MVEIWYYDWYGLVLGMDVGVGVSYLIIQLTSAQLGWGWAELSNSYNGIYACKSLCQCKNLNIVCNGCDRNNIHVILQRIYWLFGQGNSWKIIVQLDLSWTQKLVKTTITTTNFSKASRHSRRLRFGM